MYNVITKQHSLIVTWCTYNQHIPNFYSVSGDNDSNFKNLITQH